MATLLGVNRLEHRRHLSNLAVRHVGEDVPVREARLHYLGHVKNRHGLVVGGRLTPATGFAERDQAMAMVAERPGRRRITLGADKLYDTKDFVASLRELTVSPHVAQNSMNRRSAIDAHSTRHDGYAVSQEVRKRIEETMAGARKSARSAKPNCSARGKSAFSGS